MVTIEVRGNAYINRFNAPETPRDKRVWAAFMRVVRGAVLHAQQIESAIGTGAAGVDTEQTTPHIVEQQNEHGGWDEIARFRDWPTAIWFRDTSAVGGHLEIRGDHRVRS